MSGMLSAQVGINLENPRGILHVDGKKDNPKTGIPSIEQQLNDVLISEDGNVGIGLNNPSTKLDIFSEKKGALKIKDGTEGAGKILTSDNNGLAMWKTINSSKSVIAGSFNKNAPLIFSNNYVGSPYMPINADVYGLTKGKWIVNIGLTVTAMGSKRGWLHGYLKNSSTGNTQGFKFLGPAGNLTSYASIIQPAISNTNDGNLSFFSGSMIIEVTQDEPVNIMFVFEVKKEIPISFTGAAYENYFYAIPVN